MINLRSEKGTSMILFTIMVSVIASMMALSMDIGMISFEKARISHAVDAAALAGVQELVANKDNAKNVAMQYIEKNTKDLKEVKIEFDSTYRQIEVSVVKTVDNSFAKVFGKNNQDVTAKAKARIENIKSVSGVRPLAIVDQVFSFGTVYTLKEGSGDGSSGNYGGIALGGNGASVYVENLLEGYDGILSVGDQVLTQPGNIAGPTKTAITHLLGSCTHVPECTYQSYNPQCEKIITIPVVNTLDVNGKKTITVRGFATFFLEGTDNSGGHTEIKGRFISYNLKGETSNDVGDYGTYGIRLVK